MNRLIAEMADKCALYSLHKNKSRTWQFSNRGLIPALEDLELFYFQPQMPEISFERFNDFGNYRTGTFKYKSKVDNDSCNEYATGLFYQSKLKTPKLNVILVHGWRQDNERIKAIYCDLFMQNGYDIYLFTLPHHTERQDKQSSYNGEFMISANVERTLLSVRQAVVDLRALVNWLTANRTGKVVLVGISLGGLLANLTTTVEENIDGIISVFAPNDLSTITWETATGKWIKRDFEKHAFTYEQLKNSWAMMTASNFRSKIAKEKMLFISASYDKYIDFEDANELWEKWGRPERKLYPCGHTGIVLCKKSIANESLEFIKRNVFMG